MWRSEVSRHFERLVDAQIRAAEGVTHLVARDKGGRWAQVTDGPAMVEVLNSPGTECYRLSAQSPSAPILKDIMDRLFGQSTVNLDMTVAHVPAQLTDQQLRDDLAGLLGRLEPKVIDVVPVPAGEGSEPALEAGPDREG